MGDTKKNINLVGVTEVIFEGMFPAGTGAGGGAATGGEGSEFEGQKAASTKGRFGGGAVGGAKTAAKAKAAAGFKTKAKTGGPVVPGKGKGGR